MTKAIARELPKTAPSLLTVGVLVSALILSGCKPETTKDVPLPVVRPVLTELAQPDLSSQRIFNGVVQASERADLSFRTGGRLVEVLVNEGSRVTKGQLLARLDSKAVDIALASAKVELQNTRTEYQRSKSLYENRQAVSRAQFDEVTMRYNLAKNKLQEAERSLTDTFLRAPFDGIVSRRLVDNHVVVQANETIVSIHDLTNMEVAIDVPESMMVERGSDYRVQAHVPRHPNTAFDLSLKTFETEPDPATRTYGVTLSFDDLQGKAILPGMNVRVHTYQSVSEAPLSAPITAITPDNQAKQYVWEVKSDNKVEKRFVETGSLSNDRVQILSALEEGEQLVVSGTNSLSEGMLVRPTLVEVK